MTGTDAARPAAWPVVMIMGPTAGGKTELALRIAARIEVQIISVDSAMVYRRMNIGTAKPDAALLERFPHRLIDLVDPHEPYSAARFREDALQAIEQAHAEARLPLLVGGTMLYFSVLQSGLSPLPQADPALRRRLSERGKRLGWDVLHEELAQVDPEAAERIHRNDPQRIQRALEVWQLTGVALSQHHRRAQAEAPRIAPCKLVLAPADRSVLHERIAARFDAMLDAGLVDEVSALREDPRLHAELPAMRAVGYRQVWNHLDGRLSYDEMRERAVFASRQLAKRQLTWLRREPDAHWHEAPELALESICAGVKGAAQGPRSR